MATAKTKAARQQQSAPKRSRKPAPQPEAVIADRGVAISEGMKELADARTKARAKRNGTPAKPLIFSEWLKALLGGSAADLLRSYWAGT